MANQYAPPGDAEVLALFEQHGTSAAVAEAAGGSPSTWRQRRQNALRAQREQAVKTRGGEVFPTMDVTEVTDQRDADGELTSFSVRQRPTAEENTSDPGEPLPGFAYSRLSDNYRGDGTLIQKWRIQNPVKAQQAQGIKTFVEGLMDGCPAPKPIKASKGFESDLLVVIPMGDPHFGMRAHAPEAGENFDLKIAEHNTKAVVDRLVATAPPAKRAILKNLGDFFHADDNSARTKQSGNQLDVDGRWHEVIKVGSWTMVHLIQRMLQKFETIEVDNERGNHDDVSAIAMAVALDMFFHNDPRVTISDPAAYFHYTEFGVNLIGSTHGDGPKEGDLLGLMANDVPEAWGRTKHRVVHRGHFHHDRLLDLTGGSVETHRTLAASDAWHRKSGYRAKRDMKWIAYHERFGEVLRAKVNLDMIG